MSVHSGMKRFLASDGIDAIEKCQTSRPGLPFVLDLASRKKRIRDWTEVLKKYPREAKTILAGSMVQYFGGNKNKGSAWSP